MTGLLPLFSGELVVGPGGFAFDGGLVCGAGDGDGGVGGAVPVFGRVGDSPDVAVVVERDSDQEGFAVVAQRKTIGHAGRNASAGGEIA